MIRVGNGWIPRYGRLGCCVPGSGLACAVASASEVGIYFSFYFWSSLAVRYAAYALCTGVQALISLLRGIGVSFVRY